MRMLLSVLVMLFATMAHHCIVVVAVDRSVLSSVDPEPTLHTIFSTECNIYFDWQSLGLLYSWRKVGQKGKFTRLMACNKSPPPGMDVVPDTHVHPNYAVHPRTKVGGIGGGGEGKGSFRFFTPLLFCVGCFSLPR